MTSLTAQGRVVDHMAAAQVLGTDIHIYLKLGKECKWLKFYVNINTFFKCNCLHNYRKVEHVLLHYMYST